MNYRKLSGDFGTFMGLDPPFKMRCEKVNDWNDCVGKLATHIALVDKFFKFLSQPLREF